MYLGMSDLSHHLGGEFMLRVVQYWTKGLHTPSFNDFSVSSLSLLSFTATFPPFSSLFSLIKVLFYYCKGICKYMAAKWWPENSNVRRVLQEPGRGVVLQSQKAVPLGCQLGLLRPLPLALSVSLSLQSSFSLTDLRQGPGFLIAFWNEGCRPTLYLSLCLTGRQLYSGFSVQLSCPCRPFLHKNLTADFAWSWGFTGTVAADFILFVVALFGLESMN